MIVLVGFMGAGKSTVGALLARRLGLSFIDTDRAIEERAGASTESIFSTAGEGAFRALEREVVAESLTEAPGIIALGGGALEDPGTRAALASTEVIHLEVDLEEAVRRVGDGRPMLRSTNQEALFRQRAELYAAVARHVVPTVGRSPVEVAQEIATRLRAPRASACVVTVELGERSYQVHIGEGISRRLDGLLPELPEAELAFLVTHPSLVDRAAPTIASLESMGLRVATASVPEGEKSKSLGTAAELYEQLVSAGARRGDFVVGFGGGVVTDLAGFVASTYYRGVPVVHVPTTLLAQVDAAVGGKTALDLEAGKNLIGTIHQPVSVVCDVSLLESLEEAELRSGLAEVIKYGFVRAPELLDAVEHNLASIHSRDCGTLLDLVARCVAIKAEVVSEDERDWGGRAVLNYGHTFAHALEQASGYEQVRHGEAVALGMMAAAHLARVLDRIDDAVVDRHREVLGSAGLPTSAPLDLEVLEKAWERDKKFRKGVRFVLLSSIGRAEAGIAAPRGSLLEALERMGS